ncbi:helix-turn-helix domain-containing protein [Massilia sp. TN1-12]|uniref:helix-turn-helix domain-containing protein n=1 Tax=Massilia paldalensis TaxID=3377675 RepID=UPI003850CB5A
MNNRKLKKLKNEEYRAAYVSAHVDQGLAYQIRVLRESRGWDQQHLAKKLGLKSQSAIARIEDPSYGKLSLSTVKKLAKAFDVAVLTKFVPFSRFLLETELISEESLAVDSFDVELPRLEKAVVQLTPLKVFSRAQYAISATNSRGSHSGGFSAAGLQASVITNSLQKKEEHHA